MSESHKSAEDEHEAREETAAIEALDEHAKQLLIEQILAQITQSEESRNNIKQRRYEEATQVLLLFVCFVFLVVMVLLIRSGAASRYQSAVLAIRPDGSGYARELILNQSSGSESPQQDSIHPREQRR